LRVASPFVVTSLGARQEAKLSIADCAYDTNPASPVGRSVIRTRASSCTVHIAWSNVAYPAILDPQWSSTGSMSSARDFHTATLLATGKLLVVGGSSDRSEERRVGK